MNSVVFEGVEIGRLPAKPDIEVDGVAVGLKSSSRMSLIRRATTSTGAAGWAER